MAEILNIERLVSKLEELTDKINVKETLEKACLVVENEAKMKCPVAEGQLRRSITHEVDDKDGYVGTNTEYAPYVEFGTGLFSSKGTGRQSGWRYKDAKGDWHYTTGQAPQPFLLPAFENNRGEIINIFKQAIKDACKDVCG